MIDFCRKIELMPCKSEPCNPHHIACSDTWLTDCLWCGCRNTDRVYTLPFGTIHVFLSAPRYLMLTLRIEIAGRSVGTRVSVGLNSRAELASLLPLGDLASSNLPSCLGQLTRDLHAAQQPGSFLMHPAYLDAATHTAAALSRPHDKQGFDFPLQNDHISKQNNSI